jgi:hypothetical protein
MAIQRKKSQHTVTPSVRSVTDLPYDTAQTKEFLRHIRRGNYKSTSANLAKIPITRIDRWLQKGREPFNEPYTTFREEYLCAKAEHEASLVDVVQESGDAKLALDLLGRRYADHWASVKKIQKEAAAQIADYLDFLLAELEAHPEAKQLVIDISEQYESESDLNE